MQVYHPPENFELPPLWSYGINTYGAEVTFDGVVSILNFIKICQFVQKLLVGENTQTG
jgi:hypothetical protein